MKEIFFLIFLLFTSTAGLKCYVCTISASDTSDTCVQNPGAVSTGSPTVDCGLKYCTIKRQEYKDPPGRIASFYRGCESNPVYLNTVIDDADFRTYFRACTSDLCNTGNGIQSVVGTPGSGVGLNLMVPGIGGANSITPNLGIFFAIINLALYFNFRK
ncbi:uncharacterized protein LOC143910160 [Arctopsyche grandis]|uniref:uncharacterized protein LOC143910160 n=1 Tax=Arctopsyche grandis TaxID=121162 RepID=UPI00406DA1A5